MDVADAWNLSLYGNGAIWHIVAAEDAPALADFLRTELKADTSHENPILQQKTYSSPEMLERLWKVKRIHPFEVLQQPGDMVFIPAGCPHQVSGFFRK